MFKSWFSVIKKQSKVFSIGLLIGIILTLSLVVFLIKTSKNEYHHFYISSRTPTEDVKTLSTAYEKNNAVFEEKINGLNGRCTDLYVIIGIVVTLLLVMNIGIFISAQHEAQKYFTDNFSNYEKEIKRLSSSINEIYNKTLKDIATFNTKSKFEGKLPEETTEPEPEDNG